MKSPWSTAAAAQAPHPPVENPHGNAPPSQAVFEPVPDTSDDDPALPGLEPALQGIGYRQFVQVASGALDPGQALALMQRETLRYAKRQLTWFTREPGIEWIDADAPDGAEGVASLIQARLTSMEDGIE